MLQGFSLNILPIFMVLTQWYQMRLNPMQLGPEMSEAQRINAKMMRFMPFMFLVFLYFFSSALVLYWTIQNLMTILQTLLTKNVTPNLETKENKEDDQDENFQRISSQKETEDELSDQEIKDRNLLGLKSKGKIDSKLLDERFKERMKNYSPNRLAEMTEQKRSSAERKRDTLQEAYERLQKSLNKDS